MKAGDITIWRTRACLRVRPLARRRTHRPLVESTASSSHFTQQPPTPPLIRPFAVRHPMNCFSTPIASTSRHMRPVGPLARRGETYTGTTVDQPVELTPFDRRRVIACSLAHAQISRKLVVLGDGPFLEPAVPNFASLSPLTQILLLSYPHRCARSAFPDCCLRRVPIDDTGALSSFRRMRQDLHAHRREFRPLASGLSCSPTERRVTSSHEATSRPVCLACYPWPRLARPR